MPGSDDRKGASPGLQGAGTTLVPPAGETLGSSSVQRILGGRYEVRGVLGRGGMGEVWLARDVKLQVDVALKVVRPERLGEAGALERLRSEVRSARAVASPHVCRVYDLVEAEGLECVSMEYVDGTTLRQILDARSPLELAEAREIALQLLAGLGAIHEAGLVHRDVKPENVMRTRAGRVVLMDFGIAKAVASGGTVAGTPAYWAPEQAAGAAADPRADVFATGIVLAEMVVPGGARDPDARRALWLGLREDPPQVPDTPWSEAIRKAVAREPGERYPSAQALARALEEIAHRVTGIDEAQPYPGLSAFTEAEAEYFFGREAEVEEVWKKLPGRHLLAVVGPSGAGKSSFLRAGLIPAKPEGWAHLICTPGDAPFVALGQALVPEVSRDTHAMRQMLRFEDADVAVDLFRRWRSDHAEALVIVDQLEELFTLNAPEVQTRFASLLSRLVLEADIHVLLAMRDDFLLRCQEHEALRPVFSDLMPLGPPTGDALRRALVQPALKCGYRFEDEALVGEMLQAVEGERGALPLLAFAAASLWDRRDRAQGLLTRNSYEAIGGVAGALAQHAEATLEKVGTDKLPLVREMFRNLVTAEGTRAVRDVDELITVFPEEQRADAEAVLRALIDARLLTSYEAHATEPGQTAGRRVEVVHESLLTAWPRLVRWRTEDEGSAQLRDQLRQVAHLWEERGKPDDLLWTGTSYQEYQLWRSRYPGGLSDVEDAFASAMTERTHRQRNRRRTAYAVVLVAVVTVAAALGTLWRRSVQETRRAEAEAARVEAGRLLSLGRLKLADSPSAALAYAIASLERSDNDAARHFAVEALWQGPPALFLGVAKEARILRWSPDERFTAITSSEGLDLFDNETNRRRKLSPTPSAMLGLGFTRDGRRLVTADWKSESEKVFHVWAVAEGQLERDLRFSFRSAIGFIDGDDHLLVLTWNGDTPWGESFTVRRVPLDGSAEQVLGRWTPHGFGFFDLDAQEEWIGFIKDHRVLVQSLRDLASPPRPLGTHEGKRVDANFWQGLGRLVTNDDSGEVRVWDVPSSRLVRVLKSPVVATSVTLDTKGRYLATWPGGAEISHSTFLFDLTAPATAEPVPLLGSEASWTHGMSFSPDGSWLASTEFTDFVFWNLSSMRSTVIGRLKPGAGVAFTRDGHLLTGSDSPEGGLKRWPLSYVRGDDIRVIWSRPDRASTIAYGDPAGRFVILQTSNSELEVVPFDGSTPRVYALTKPLRPSEAMGAASLSPDGRFLAASVGSELHPELNAVRIIDRETSGERTLDTHPKAEERCQKPGSSYDGFAIPVWLPDGRLFTDGDAGLRLWDLAAGTSRLLRPCKTTPCGCVQLEATSDSRTIFRLDKADSAVDVSTLNAFDVVSGTTRDITSHGNKIAVWALDASGTILVTGDVSGVLRVGPATGDEPHLLFGHTARVTSVAVSPDGRAIASSSDDGTIRLWPMPDLSKPPLHTLPLDEVLATLRALTNLRAARDPSSDTGWKVEIGPFPGWAKVPTWQP